MPVTSFVPSHMNEVKLDFIPKGKTPEECTDDEIMESLKKTASVRDQMGGSLHFNILNDQAYKLYLMCEARDMSASVLTDMYSYVV